MKYTFEKFKLNEKILKSLKSLGYNIPSRVQREVIPKLLKGQNLVVRSKTGSGKTASFAIPLCENINVDYNNIQALIVVPTRELALQVKDEISDIGRLKKVRCSAIFGKQSIKDQIAELKQRVHIVVATPGRILDHINRGSIKLENVKYLVIDEADKMFNKGFVEQMEKILLNLPKEKIVSLFSATIDEEIKYICEKYMLDYSVINIEENESDTNQKTRQIDDKIIKANGREKYILLKELIYSENPKSVIIFCNTKEKVSKLYNKMSKEGFLIRELHADLSQERRIFVIKDFKNQKFNVLVSSDVASRGIHIDDISLVINYDVPQDKENYIHRIGRTGRKGNSGKAITIVTEKDEKYIENIETYIGYKINELKDIEKSRITHGKVLFEEYSKGILKKVSKRKKVDKNSYKSKDIKLNIESEVVKLYLNAGKKKKIRVLDIVGAFSNIKGITNDDIGVIEVQDLCSYVDILNYKGDLILKKYKEIPIKKKMVKVKRDIR
ncbi:TPA: DEAD/DEAH box helicase [Clostridioides difficile]|uniref:DEAD/DEAH box helicase n=1 Tax=Clostridioides difficile TaxID=1496 RepID=UPI0007BC4AE0|nr:DEAD/DEAH box helicase [Clostridioides difficile]EGT3787137.1 DEAD/DEAH box helicase [Clostridioides difficile]EGT3903892.1 DEAD/DEAH box helicase [Clostridioides difficile]EGT4183749.1 DEAD/DEAH box helicase [Clostridioides difficile]EGT4206615.1 DEAD/DEAH box helicase [Clostridioides difficile]EGT4215947.1 DEAD/DEAH box helicase [Clostridioides difficile]